MRVFQRAGGLHGAQGRYDHDHAALVVACAGAGGFIALALEFLERAVGLEHRIKMGDQQHFLAAFFARLCRHQMAGAPGLCHVGPLDLEAQWLQFSPHHVAHGLYTCEVHRARVLVHQPFQQGNRARILRVNSGDNLGLGC